MFPFNMIQHMYSLNFISFHWVKVVENYIHTQSLTECHKRSSRYCATHSLVYYSAAQELSLSLCVYVAHSIFLFYKQRHKHFVTNSPEFELHGVSEVLSHQKI